MNRSQIIRGCVVSLAVMCCGVMNVCFADNDVKAVFPGNEAVKSSPTGKRVVEYSPQVSTDADELKGPNGEKRPHGISFHTLEMVTNNPLSSLYMIEGPSGLLECAEIATDKRVCRTSTLGKEKHPREWSVKLQGVWQMCVLAAPGVKPDHDKYICNKSRSPAQYAMQGDGRGE